MPETGEEVTVTERDVTLTENANRRREFLNRVDSFIRTASAEEVTHLKKSLAVRSTALGISTATPQPKTTDRILARFAAELVPIILTLFIVFPVVMWGILRVMSSKYLATVTAGCPPTCETNALLLWAVVSGVGFLLAILAYYSLRKLMIRARR